MRTCLACDSADATRWACAADEEYCTTTDSFTYYRCDQCSALFIDPVPRDMLHVIYPPNYYSFDSDVTESALFRIKDMLDQRFFRKYLGPLPQAELAVLDVGGGAGVQLSSLQAMDRRVKYTAVVDIDEEAAVLARSRGHDYFCGRFEEFPENRSFDVILMLNLIEHVDNPQALLTKAGALLSPGGILIIKTPNVDSLDARIFRHRNWGGYHCPRHWVLFNKENFMALLNRANLKARHFQYTQGAPFWTTSVLFALSRRGWINISKKHPAPSHRLYPLLNVAFAAFDMLRGIFAKTSQMLVVVERA